MIRRTLATFTLIASLVGTAAAQERVTVGTMRDVANGGLFLAAAQGYFKAEGLDLEMTAYKSDKDVADAVASGATDFGLGAFTPAAFTYTARGFMKAVAAQAREKKSYDGNQVLVSNAAFARGLRKLEDFVNRSVGVTEFGSAFHYQVAQIARVKKFDERTVTVRSLRTLDGVAEALGTGKVDAAILPGAYAREMLVAGQARLLTWYSEVDEQQLGALFVGAKVIAQRRTVVEKFVRAYRRGTADYSAALMRHDSAGKRMSTSRSREVATIIARYVYPGKAKGPAAATVEAGAYYIEPQAALDAADVARQVEWLKAQNILAKSVDPNAVIDASFVTAAK
jgi:NitT/TauT family transport system substrate-binding protein